MSYKGQKIYKSYKVQIHNRKNIYANKKIKLINNLNGNSWFKIQSINKSRQIYAKNRKLIKKKSKICMLNHFEAVMLTENSPIKTRQLLHGSGKKPATIVPPSIMKYANEKII